MHKSERIEIMLCCDLPVLIITEVFPGFDDHVITAPSSSSDSVSPICFTLLNGACHQRGQPKPEAQ
jgi:hypothetical protein